MNSARASHRLGGRWRSRRLIAVGCGWPFPGAGADGPAPRVCSVRRWARSRRVRPGEPWSDPLARPAALPSRSHPGGGVAAASGGSATMAGHRARGREGRDAAPPSRPRIYGALSGAVAGPETAASRALRGRASGAGEPSIARAGENQPGGKRSCSTTPAARR